MDTRQLSRDFNYHFTVSELAADWYRSGLFGHPLPAVGPMVQHAVIPSPQTTIFFVLPS